MWTCNENSESKKVCQWSRFKGHMRTDTHAAERLHNETLSANPAAIADSLTSKSGERLGRFHARAMNAIAIRLFFR